MQEEVRAYRARLERARFAIDDGQIVEAIKEAVAAWEHVEVRMRYGARYEDMEFDTLECVELVLQYAPLVLDADSLDRLEVLLKKQKHVERKTSKSLTAALDVARARLNLAYRAFDLLERRASMSHDELNAWAGPDAPAWKRIAMEWLRIGVVENSDDGKTCRLRTNLREHWRTKCHACGKGLGGPKWRFLEKLPCPKCGSESGFVFVARHSGGESTC